MADLLTSRDREPFRPDRAVVEQWAESRLDVRQRGPEEWVCVCPFHQDATTHKPDLYLNVEKGVYLCMSAACGARGGILQLVARLDGVDLASVRSSMSLSGPSRVRALRDRLRQSLLPEPELPVISQARVDEQRDGTYWRTRGLTEQTIDDFELGLDWSRARATIPYRDDLGRCRAFIGRATRPDQQPRYLYPTSFPLRTAIFNLWRIDPTLPVITVEGTTDAMAVHQAGFPNVIALFSAHVHDGQLRWLRALRLISFLDRDSAGAAGTRRLCREHPRVFQVARYSPSLPADLKDPAAIGPAEIARSIAGAISSTSWARRQGHRA